MDFDPRDYDSRDDERRDTRDQTRELGRGSGGDSRQSDSHKELHDSREDSRWAERAREFDPREVFTRDVYLPRGLERGIVRHRGREYTLRGSESRTLATVGAFRVDSSRDLRDGRDRDIDPRSGDLRHLREQSLVDTVRVPGSREHAVFLTKEGRGLLESHRDPGQDRRQAFYDGLRRARELEHDIQVYRAYEREALRQIDLHWHDLRHEGACRLLAEHVDIRTIQLMPAMPTSSRRSGT